MKKKFSRKRFLTHITNEWISRIIFSRVRLYWYRKVMGFVIGDHSSILTGFKVAALSNLVIGEHTVINNGCRFDNRFKITIGNNVSVTYGTTVFTKGHDIDDPYFATQGASVTIDDYVWICAYAVILPGIHIGKGAVILPCSVVTSDVEPYHVVGGNPAKFIRMRSTDLRYELEWDQMFPFFG